MSGMSGDGAGRGMPLGEGGDESGELAERMAHLMALKDQAERLKRANDELQAARAAGITSAEALSPETRALMMEMMGSAGAMGDDESGDEAVDEREAAGFVGDRGAVVAGDFDGADDDGGDDDGDDDGRSPEEMAAEALAMNAETGEGGEDEGDRAELVATLQSRLQELQELRAQAARLQELRSVLIARAEAEGTEGGDAGGDDGDVDGASEGIDMARLMAAMGAMSTSGSAIGGGGGAPAPLAADPPAAPARSGASAARGAVAPPKVPSRVIESKSDDDEGVGASASLDDRFNYLVMRLDNLRREVAWLEQKQAPVQAAVEAHRTGKDTEATMPFQEAITRQQALRGLLRQRLTQLVALQGELATLQREAALGGDSADDEGTAPGPVEEEDEEEEDDTPTAEEVTSALGGAESPEALAILEAMKRKRAELQALKDRRSRLEATLRHHRAALADRRREATEAEEMAATADLAVATPPAEVSPTATKSPATAPAKKSDGEKVVVGGGGGGGSADAASGMSADEANAMLEDLKSRASEHILALQAIKKMMADEAAATDGGEEGEDRETRMLVMQHLAQQHLTALKDLSAEAGRLSGSVSAPSGGAADEAT